MVYLYRKKLGTKSYYYLRASVKTNGKLVTKDIAYLGNDVEKIQEKLEDIPKEYKQEIRKTYRTLKKFIEANRYIELAKQSKLKKDNFLTKEQQIQIEACRLHWNKEILSLDEKTKAEVLKNFIIEFAFNTAAIEGNTITLKEAEKLLLEELTPKNRTLREIYDLQNTEKVFFKYFGKKQTLNQTLIESVHEELLKNIDDRTGYRTAEVRVFKSRFASSPAPYVKTDMDLVVKWFDSCKEHLFVKLCAFHHKFEKVHPFMDGNGRTGRMLVTLFLTQNNFPPSIVRKKNRSKYISALSKADKSELQTLEKKNYAKLIDFLVSEYTANYWNVFL